jgi:hypothetical protein
MLIYHPAYDIYHAAFRMLVLLSNLGHELQPLRRLRILDFYLLFPAELGRVQFPRNLLPKKKKWVDLQSRYNTVPDPRRIFDELEPFQMAAVQMLVGTGLVVRTNNPVEGVALVNGAVPESLAFRLSIARAQKAELIELLTKDFSNLDLYGQNGLKARTGLFEHRYDPV